MTWTELKYELSIMDVERLAHAHMAKLARDARAQKKADAAPRKGGRR